MILGIELTPRQLRDLMIWYDAPLKQVGEYIYRIEEGGKCRDVISYSLDQYNASFLNSVKSYMDINKIHRVDMLDLASRKEPRVTCLFSEHKSTFSLETPHL